MQAPVQRVAPSTAGTTVAQRQNGTSAAAAQRVILQTPSGVSVAQLTTPLTVTSPGASQPITVHIQQTQQGPRLTVPASQLHQLPGIVQIVQTPTGQQLICTSASAVATTTQQQPITASMVTAQAASRITVTKATTPGLRMTTATVTPTRTLSLPTTTTTAAQGVVTTTAPPPVKSVVMPTMAVPSAALAHTDSTSAALTTVSTATRAEPSPTVAPSVMRPVVRVAPLQLELKGGQLVSLRRGVPIK
ncbi:PREDICTED: mucin-2-like, partial [Priapulus caudatus]|uniref:Mucin-2-like n=1 Tax=Priapulus caudatus TaxID=37621 RepID=A0ABM1EMQ5_PRICU